MLTATLILAALVLLTATDAANDDTPPPAPVPVPRDHPRDSLPHS